LSSIQEICCAKCAVAQDGRWLCRIRSRLPSGRRAFHIAPSTTRTQRSIHSVFFNAARHFADRRGSQDIYEAALSRAFFLHFQSTPACEPTPRQQLGSKYLGSWVGPICSYWVFCAWACLWVVAEPATRCKARRWMSLQVQLQRRAQHQLPIPPRSPLRLPPQHQLQHPRQLQHQLRHLRQVQRPRARSRT
jgi:hypothetical protein